MLYNNNYYHLKQIILINKMEGLSIKSCFIFNSKLKSPKKKPSDDEAQDAKLLYYYPKNEELLVKRSNIGIIEGTLSFMESFEKTNTQFLLTELNKFYFVTNNYENDFSIVFILEKGSPMFSYYQSIATKKKWLKKIIDNFYNMFSLFHHSFTKFFLSDETPEIRVELPEKKMKKIEDFTLNFIEYFSQMRLPFIDNVVYFPLQEQLQANILLGVQRLNEKIPDMAMSSIIYKGHIIHNQLPLECFSLLYNMFYSSFDFNPKYNNFKSPPEMVIHSISQDAVLSQEKKGDKSGDTFFEDENEVSPFRKMFGLGTSMSDYIIGIKKGKANNYNMFIPLVHVRQLDENFKLLAYYYNGMLIFIFLNEKFNIPHRLSTTLTKVEKWVERYFKENFDYLEKIYRVKMTQPDSITYAYCNNANRSLKLSGLFLNKKNKSLDEAKFELLQKVMLMNSEVQMTSLTKYKGYYIYYINSCERNVVMVYNDSLSLPQLKKLIEENKGQLFEYIYMI